MKRKNPRRPIQLHEHETDFGHTFTLSIYRRGEGLVHQVNRAYSEKEAALARVDIRAETVRELVSDWRAYRNAAT